MSGFSLTGFANQMNEIMPVVMREFAKRQINDLYKGKITLQQFLILEVLHKEKELTMTSLSHYLNVTTAAMTGLIERLVRDGYVQRGPDDADRRIIKVRLTAQGSSLVKRINQQRQEMIIKIFGKINENDRRDYLRILMQIKDILLSEN